MAVPEVLEEKWAALRNDLAHAGIPQPRLAVTELQLFAHLARASSNAPVRLTRENLPGQGSITEAMYDVLIYHAAIRLAPFVELITHSATVNHGGGLRKERERVWANPCHYAQAAFAELAGATPVVCEIEAAEEQAPLVLPDLRKVTKSVTFAAVDALAARASDGGLLISLVNRGDSSEPVQLRIEFAGFAPAEEAFVRTLAARSPAEGNTLEQPEAVLPMDTKVRLRDDQLELALPPYSVLRVRVPARSGT
jgi:alpha-N-arabinofuranosidase